MKCPKCGAVNQDGAVICTACGEKLTETPSTEKTNIAASPVRPRDEDFDIPDTTHVRPMKRPENPDQNLWIILAIICSTALISVLGVLIYRGMKDNQRTYVEVVAPSLTESIPETQTTTAEEEPSSVTIDEKTKSPTEDTGESAADTDSAKADEEAAEASAEAEEAGSDVNDSESAGNDENGGATDGEDEASGEAADGVTDGQADGESTEDPQNGENAQETRPAATEAGEDVEYGGMIYHIANGSAVLTRCYSADSVTWLPAEIYGVRFTGIAAGAFDGCTHLVAILIQAGCTSVEDGAFTNCSNLKEIVIPDSVTVISAGCFTGSPSVTIISSENNAQAQSAAAAAGLAWRAGNTFSAEYIGE